MPGGKGPFPVSSTYPKQFSVEGLEHDPIAGETRPRRNHKVCTGKLLSTPENGVNTIFDIVVRGVQRFGDAPALGTRPILGSHVEVRKVENRNNGSEESADQQKRWSTFERGPYSWMSFKDYGMLVHHVGAGYRKLGMERGDKVHIYAATRLAGQSSFVLANLAFAVNSSSDSLETTCRIFVPYDIKTFYQKFGLSSIDSKAKTR